MIESFDYRVFLTVASALLALVGTVPYIRDILRGKTQPHFYTWLIWLITQGTAAAGILYGGGGIAGFALVVGTSLIGVILLLSFKYGTKNITRSDTITLIAALSAVMIWWQLDNPLLAVLMATAIDGLGYIPTFRKSWSEPHSETKSSWFLFFLSPMCALLALQEFNLLTSAYLLFVVVANLSLFLMLLFRQRT